AATRRHDSWMGPRELCHPERDTAPCAADDTPLTRPSATLSRRERDLGGGVGATSFSSRAFSLREKVREARMRGVSLEALARDGTASRLEPERDPQVRLTLIQIVVVSVVAAVARVVVLHRGEVAALLDAQCDVALERD